MSVQAVEIKGIGYSFPYNKELGILKGLSEKEKDFLVLDTNLEGCYYKMRDLKSSDRISPLRIFIDGADGEYLNVLIVTSARHIENTMGDPNWHNQYRNDEYVKKYAKMRLMNIIREEVGDPKEITFIHYQ